MQYVAMGTVHGDVLGCPWSNSRHFTAFHRSSEPLEPLEPLGFVGPFGLTGAGSWDLLVNVCKRSLYEFGVEGWVPWFSSRI